MRTFFEGLWSHLPLETKKQREPILHSSEELIQIKEAFIIEAVSDLLEQPVTREEILNALTPEDKEKLDSIPAKEEDQLQKMALQLAMRLRRDLQERTQKAA